MKCGRNGGEVGRLKVQGWNVCVRERERERDEVVGGSQAACNSSYLRLVVICESQDRTGLVRLA